MSTGPTIRTFGRHPIGMGRDRRLSPAHVVTLSVICDHMDINNECYPSEKKLSEELGIHQRSVRRHMRALIDAGYIKLTKRGPYAGKITVQLDAAPDCARDHITANSTNSRVNSERPDDPCPVKQEKTGHPVSGLEQKTGHPVSGLDEKTGHAVSGLDSSGSEKTGHPVSKRPDTRCPIELNKELKPGLGLERRSLSPEVSEAYRNKLDPENFSMTMDWKIGREDQTRLEQKFMAVLGVDPFWRQVERFMNHHCNLGTVDTQKGFSRSLENWLDRANANREKIA